MSEEKKYAEDDEAFPSDYRKRIFQRYKLTHTYNTTLLLLARSVKSVYIMGYIVKPSAFRFGYGDG